MKKYCFALIILLLGYAGCSSVPDWARASSGIRNYNGEKVFFAVGRVSGIRNKSMAYESADARARAELARVFDTYVGSFLQDYWQSVLGNEMDQSDEEQLVKRASKQITDQTIIGSMIPDHWVEEDGTYHAMAVLKFEDALQRIKSRTEEIVKQRVKENADTALKKLDEEIGKRRR